MNWTEEELAAVLKRRELRSAAAAVVERKYRRVAGEPESSFQRAVVALAKLNNWKVAHFRKARTKDGHWITPLSADGAGFPDLLLVREHILYRELKSARGALSEEQREWREALLAAGQDWAVWRPSDWDLITATLKLARVEVTVRELVDGPAGEVRQ